MSVSSLRAPATSAGRVCVLVLLAALNLSFGASAGESSAGTSVGTSAGTAAVTPGDALMLYDESGRPALDYEATVSVKLPLGTGRFDVVGMGGVTYLRPRTGRQTPPDLNQMAFEAGTGQLSAADLVRQNYTVDLKDGPPVLGRQTWEITVIPKWPGSPSRRVLVDRATRVRLVVEDRDHTGRLLQRREVVSLRLPPNRPGAKTLSRSGRKRAWLTPAQASVRVGSWLRYPRYLPPGYRLVGVRPGAKPGSFVHLAYFDGLGVISLYEREVPWWARPGVGEGREKGGLVWTHGGVRFYLVGDVPPEELQRIAASVR